MKPVMFCRNSSGILRWSHSSMKCAPFSADSLNSTPLLAMMPTGWPWMCAKPVTSVVPYSALNSCEPAAVDEARDHLADVVGHARSRRAPRRTARSGRARARRSASPPTARPRAARGWPRCRARSRSACASSSARWSVTPEVRECRSPPPSSSAVTTSPVAAFTSGGPAEEDRALVAHDHGLVAHRRHVGAAGRARTQHRGDLRDALARSSWPGCRRSGRSARGRGTPRPAAAGTRRRSRPGRRTAAGSASAISCARRCFLTVIG